MKILDLTLGHGKSSFPFAVLDGKPSTAAAKEKAVWIDIDNAFSRPVRLTHDQADYAPTQILAELFRSHGYQAIGCKSQFGDDGEKKGYNIAVFNPDDVEIITGAPCKISSIKVAYEQSGNEWFKRQ